MLSYQEVGVIAMPSRATAGIIAQGGDQHAGSTNGAIGDG